MECPIGACSHNEYCRQDGDSDEHLDNLQVHLERNDPSSVKAYERVYSRSRGWVPRSRTTRAATF